MSDLETFKTLARALDGLGGDNAALAAARRGVEDAMNIWLDEVRAHYDSRLALKQALSLLSADQLHQAIQNAGAPVYRRLLDACGPDLRRLRLESKVVRGTSNADLDLLMARGFDYDGGKYRDPASDWLVRGADYAEARFRKDHPRKNPVMTFWEGVGLIIPSGGLCEEGAQMMAEVIRQGKLTRKAQTACQARTFLTDWRIIFCILQCKSSLPFSINQSMSQIFGTELRAAVFKCFSRGSSSHEEIAYRGRMAKLPSLEEVLKMPRDANAVIPLLADLGIQVAAKEEAA